MWCRFSRGDTQIYAELYIEVDERDDDYSNEELVSMLYEEVTNAYYDVNQISYNEKNSSFYSKGYSGDETKWCDHIFVKIEDEKVYILCVTYRITENLSNEDLHEREYVVENIYRMCSFTDSEEDVRTYEQFLSEQ